MRGITFDQFHAGRSQGRLLVGTEMMGVASWFTLPCVCLSGMREIGYAGRVEVYEVSVHQAAALN